MKIPKQEQIGTEAKQDLSFKQVMAAFKAEAERMKHTKGLQDKGSNFTSQKPEIFVPKQMQITYHDNQTKM